jgi:hypothetical protein
VQHSAKFSLIGEAEVVTAGKLDRHVLKPERRVLPLNQRESAGHSEMDHNRCLVIEIEKEILRSAVDAHELATHHARRYPHRVVVSQDAGKGSHAQSRDPLTYDPVDERATNSFDFGEFWHTGQRPLGGGLNRWIVSRTATIPARSIPGLECAIGKIGEEDNDVCSVGGDGLHILPDREW